MAKKSDGRGVGAQSRNKGRGVGRIEDMSEARLRRGMSDKRDAKRARDIDRLAERAAAGDAEALDRLYRLASFSGKREGAATRDARNWARYRYGQATHSDVDYLDPGDGQSPTLNAIGGGLKLLAPVAGALIPGVGMLGAGAIGAAGSAAGGALRGESFDPLKTLLAGGAAAGGNALLGNGLGRGPTGWMGGGDTALSGVPGMTVPGTDAGAQVLGAAKSAGGWLGGAAKTAGSWVAKHPKALATGVGLYLTAKQQQQAQDLRNKAVGMATDDWQSRQQFRDQLAERIMQSPPGGSPMPTLPVPGPYGTSANAALASAPRALY